MLPTPWVPRQRRLEGRVYAALRWMHVYLSMISFMAIFFFAITGITLNHPEWTFGISESAEDFVGELPVEWRSGETVDWLAVAEHMRAEHGIRGALADYRMDEFEGSIAFRAPGYFADAFIDPETGSYDLTVVRMGAVGVLNELHRGTDGGAAWSWLIDIAGAFLALLALTGLGILVFLKRFRRPGLIVMAGGSVLVFLLVIRLVS